MSDDERLARLTELARRVFPELGVHVSVEESANDTLYATVMTRTRDNIYNTPVKIVHPRCGDALEAALLVLVDDVVVDDAARLARADAAFVRLTRGVPAWVEQIAARLDGIASHLRDVADLGVNHGIRLAQSNVEQCAAELRARAKGGVRD